MKKESSLKLLTFLPITTELMCILLLPAQIPVHYSMNFEEITFKLCILALTIFNVLNILSLIGAFVLT